MSNNRPQRLAAACATYFLALLASISAAAAPLKVAFVYYGPIGDHGWTYQHEQGRQAVQKEFGDKVVTSYVENVPESAEAEKVLRKLVADGNQLIFTTSYGYGPMTLAVAKDNPKVWFEHATGDKTASNVGTYQSRFYEGAYLLGVIAGKMSKSHVIGFVGSFPIPEVIRNIDAYTLGARSSNPAVKTKVVWVDTWFDPEKERKAAEDLIAQGADVLAQNTDSPSPLLVARDKGIYAFGWNSDMSHYSPKTQLTANIQNWSVYYIKEVGDALAGKWKAESTAWGFKEGMVQLAPYSTDVPVDVLKQVEGRKKALASGSFFVFTGPIKDQSGATRVAAGAKLPEDQLWSMNWFVEGVDSPLPK